MLYLNPFDPNFIATYMRLQNLETTMPTFNSALTGIRQRRRSVASAPNPSKQSRSRHVINLPVSEIKPYAQNARTHSGPQIDMIARSIEEFGFVNPVLIDENNSIIAGHGRFEAAVKLGWATIPSISLEHLSPEQVRAYRIADNRIAELSECDLRPKFPPACAESLRFNL